MHFRVAGQGAGGKRFVWAWGSTGEEKWDPNVEIGVDWKSLVKSGLFPLTTDFFPDGRSLKMEYSIKVVFQIFCSCESCVCFVLNRKFL